MPILPANEEMEKLAGWYCIFLGCVIVAYLGFVGYILLS